MARKRLADLIRDEAARDSDPTPTPSTPTAAAGEPETEAPAPVPLDLPKTAGTTLDPSPGPTITVEATAVPAAEPASPLPIAARSARTTKAELSQIVEDLEADLSQAQHREAQLYQQISTLVADLQEQQVLVKQLHAKLEPKAQQIQELEAAMKRQTDLVQTLQTEIDKSDPVKQQLADAKKMIMRLTEENTRLMEANTPVAAPAPAAIVPPGRSRYAPRIPAARTGLPPLPPQPTSVPELEDHRLAPAPAPKAGAMGRYIAPTHKHIREQSIQHGQSPNSQQQNSLLSDDDIGWVD